MGSNPSLQILPSTTTKARSPPQKAVYDHLMLLGHAPFGGTRVCTHVCPHTQYIYINHNLYPTVASLKRILVKTMCLYSSRDAGNLALFKCLCSRN